MRIAILGTRGVPARYGGFETAVEEIGAGLAARGHEVTVYCRTGGGEDRYRGMRRVVVPAVRRRALETISHAGLSTLHALRRRPDAVLIMNAANAPFVLLLRAAGLPAVLHLDGHDGRRAKWRGPGARYYTWATRLGVRFATRVVVDSRAVQRELGLSEVSKAVFIPYGATASGASPEEAAARLAEIGLTRGGYHLVVARFEPENHVLEIIEGYSASKASMPLVVVGFEGYPGSYTQHITAAAQSDKRIRIIGPIWDQGLLDLLYDGAVTYLHGHSVGGTNPSLLRAMIHAAPVIAFDCPYNRETTGGAALWFVIRDDVAEAVERAEADPTAVREEAMQGRRRATRVYVWADVVAAYESLLAEVCNR